MESETDVVQVSQGLLQGRKTTTKSGGPLLCFQGIPYAKPPVGPLRFKPPQPPEPWNGIYKAQEEPPVCPQRENGVFRGQEDCLYLNVYTQEINPQNLKPVMFWIHGGGFVIGSGNTDMYGPDYLVDAGVLLVTFNYRLGVLGFLSLDNEDCTGNMGLKDQVAALLWVQQNIESFGGDPNNVTIFGESAGAICVSFHMVSPMTKGLFHKAIAQSGSALNHYAYTFLSKSRSFAVGQRLGLKTKDEKELFSFLQNVDLEKLVKEAENIIARVENTSGLRIVFVPTVEKVVPGQQPYLAQHQEILLKNGQFHHVPYMTGTVTHEGMINLRAIVRKPQLLKGVNDHFENVLPRQIRDALTDSQIQELCNKVKKFYFQNSPITMDNVASYSDLNTDMHIAAGVCLAAKYVARSSSFPVYFYNFSYDGLLGCGKMSMGPKAAILSGPYHGDDLGYLFRLGLYDPDLDPDSNEVKVRSKVIALWTNFAKTGNPTPHRTPELPIEWLPFTPQNERYLFIDEQLYMGTYLRNERMAFWENIYQLAKL
ncbi:Carboxylic ester hydrolase [Gryllus bimaculatus]|nr:Carboxylic ester hydrolase [Gryllus bimaculatus]